MTSNRAVGTGRDGGILTKDVQDEGHRRSKVESKRALFGAREYWTAEAKENSSGRFLVGGGPPSNFERGERLGGGTGG